VPDKEDVTGNIDEWWWELVDGNEQAPAPGMVIATTTTTTTTTNTTTITTTTPNPYHCSPGAPGWQYQDRRGPYRGGAAGTSSGGSGGGGVSVPQGYPIPPHPHAGGPSNMPQEDSSKMVNDEVVVNSLLQLSKAAMPVKRIPFLLPPPRRTLRSYMYDKTKCYKTQY